MHPLERYLTKGGITVEEFAARIGVTANSVYRYKAGKRVPRREVLQKIATATDGKITANDFLLDLQPAE